MTRHGFVPWDLFVLLVSLCVAEGDGNLEQQLTASPAAAPPPPDSNLFGPFPELGIPVWKVPGPVWSA